MELSASRTSVATDDYSLITYEKCNPPRAKLFIVFLASLIVATIIVLLVVLTRLDPLQNTDDGGLDPQCSDIAVIGAGLAGSYASWRLRDTNRSVTLYERSARPGGRFYTVRTPGRSPGGLSEYGASFFIPSIHPLMVRIAEELGLDTEELPYDGYQWNSVSYVRGEFVDTESLCTEGCPYRLRGNEQGKSPHQLLRLLLETADVDLEQNVDPNTTEWRAALSRKRLKDVLLQSGSHEAYIYLRDTLYWWEYFPDGNSLVFLDYVTENFPLTSESEKRLTIKGGMDRLVSELITQTKQANSRFSVFYDSEIASIDSQPGFSYFSFSSTDGATENIPLCAEQTILALPPDDVLRLKLSPDDVSDIWRSRFEALRRLDMLRVVVWHGHDDGSPYPEGAPVWSGARTDLPIQDARVVYSSCGDERTTPEYFAPSGSTTGEPPAGASHRCSTGIQVNIYGDQLGYWIRLLSEDGYVFDGVGVVSVDPTSSAFARQLLRYLAEVLSTNQTARLDPDSVAVGAALWSAGSSTPAFHAWKPGVDWDAAARRIRFPIDGVRLYLAGSGYAAGYLQFWAEGALASVDELFDDVTLT